MAQVLMNDPVTCTFRASEWHGLMRDVVNVATSLENYLADLKRSADPRRDAWVLARADVLQHHVQQLDDVAELLANVQARPVPG